MPKKNRKKMAATATRRRKARRARKAKKKVTGIESIRRRFAACGLAAYAVIEEADGEVDALRLDFHLNFVSDSSSAEVKARDLTILVVPDYEAGYITVYAPRAWTLKGLSDQTRERVLENLLDGARALRLGTRLRDGDWSPTVTIAADSPAEEVVRAAARVLCLVLSFDDAVRGAIETGSWVPPEVPQVDDDAIACAYEEFTGRFWKEYEERTRPLRTRVESVLERLQKPELGRERVLAAVKMAKCAEKINEIFFFRGQIKIMGSPWNLRAIEIRICVLEAAADDLEADGVTAD